MIKSILAYLNGSAADQSVLTECANVARIFGGHIDALRVVPDSEVLRTEAAQVEIGMSAAIADMLAAYEAYHAERTRAARAQFEEFCNRAGIVPSGPVTAAFHERTGDIVREIVGESRFHDLAVIAGGPERPDRLAAESLGTIIVASGRPVILAPPDAHASTFKTIAVAWKSVPESARAVSAALPLMRHADQVHVLGAPEDNSGSLDCLDCADATTAYVRRHGIKANCHFVLPAGRSVPDAVVEQAQNLGAELLVMGGYGHSRAREFILGGFTRRVIAGLGIPVFIIH